MRIYLYGLRQVMFFKSEGGLLNALLCRALSWYVIVLGAQSVGHTRRTNRLSAIFGRVGKAARHTFLFPSSSFLPASTSTPRLSVAKSAGDQRPSSAFSRSLATPLFDHSVSTVSEAGTEGEVRSQTESEIPAETQLDGEEPSSPYSVTSESPLFRVPKVPPRNRARAAHGKSQSALTDLRCRAVVDKRSQFAVSFVLVVLFLFCAIAR